MIRRTFISSTVGTLAAAGLSEAQERTPASDQKPKTPPEGAPNILWICTDQQRWDTIGSLGNPHIRTPHLDALAKEGMAFTHAYCQNPICTPSRASFLTGKYPRSIDACKNGNDSWEDEADVVDRALIAEYNVRRGGVDGGDGGGAAAPASSFTDYSVLAAAAASRVAANYGRRSPANASAAAAANDSVCGAASSWRPTAASTASAEEASQQEAAEEVQRRAERAFRFAPHAPPPGAALAAGAPSADAAGAVTGGPSDAGPLGMGVAPLERHG